MRIRKPKRFQELPESVGQRGQARVRDCLRRTSVTGKVQREDRSSRTDGIYVEEPVVEVAAEAVDEDDRVALTRALGIAQAAALRVGETVGWTLLLLVVIRRRNLERRNI